MWRLAGVCFFLFAATAVAQHDALESIRELTEEKKYAQALADLDEFLDHEPNHVEGKLYRGVILTRKGDIDGAITSFSALSAEYPDLPEPYNNLAVLYAAQRKYDEARLALIKAVELQPSYDTAHENLGDLYSKLAALSYQEAHRLNPGNARAEEKTAQLHTLLQGPPKTVAGDMEVLAVQPSTNTVADTEASAYAQASADASKKTQGSYCYRAGEFTESARASQANEWFSARGAQASIQQVNGQRLIGHRVFVPPFENAQLADAQIAELKTKGIIDVMRINTPPEVNAISLGVYTAKQAAERRVEQMRNLGVEASIQPRYRDTIAWLLSVVSVGKPIDKTAFRQKFSEQALSTVDCP